MIGKFRTISGSNKLMYYNIPVAPTSSSTFQSYASSGTTAVYFNPDTYTSYHLVKTSALDGSGITVKPNPSAGQYPLQTLGSFSYVNGRFVHIYRTNALSGTGVVNVSADNGESFTTYLVPLLNTAPVPAFNRIIYSGGLYMIFHGNAPYTRSSSPDLINWTNTTYTGPSVQVNYPIVFNGDLYAAVVSTSGRIIKSTDNGLSWFLVYNGPAGGITRLEINGNKLFYVSSANDLIESENGTTWTSRPLVPDITFPTSFSRAIVTNDTEAYQYGPRLYVRPKGTDAVIRQVPIPVGANQNTVSPANCLSLGTGIISIPLFSGTFKYLP